MDYFIFCDLSVTQWMDFCRIFLIHPSAANFDLWSFLFIKEIETILMMNITMIITMVNVMITTKARLTFVAILDLWQCRAHFSSGWRMENGGGGSQGQGRCLLIILWHYWVNFYFAHCGILHYALTLVPYMAPLINSRIAPSCTPTSPISTLHQLHCTPIRQPNTLPANPILPLDAPAATQGNITYGNFMKVNWRVEL